MNYIFKFFCIYLFIFCSCGMPSTEVFEELKEPQNLEIINTSLGSIEIKFKAHNSERLFIGYNVYMNSSSKTELYLSHSRHIASDRQINKEVEQKSILKNLFQFNYPTIQDNNGNDVNNARTKLTFITYTIRAAPENDPLGSTKWYIGVSAFARNHIESKLSNIVQIQ